MTQPNHQEPNPDRLAPAIRLVAHSIIFLAGAVMFGMGAPNVNGTGAIGLLAGSTVMFVAGIMFFLTLGDKM